MTYFISRLILKVILRIFFGFRVTGQQNLPKRGPFIMASNHASYLDPPVVGVSCNTAAVMFMAKRELFEHRYLGWWFSAVDCIPVERESVNFKPLKTAIESLKQGKVVGIFPEGKRSEDGRLQEAEAGIGLIASKSGAPIIPICVEGTKEAMPRGAKSIKLRRVRAKIGEPVDISEGSLRFSSKKDIYEYIGKKVMEAIARLKNG